MSWKKSVNIHCEEKTVKLAYMAEMQSRNHSWGSKTTSKGSSRPRHTKSGQQSNEIKSFGLTNQSSKSLGQIGGFMCGKE